MLYGTDVQIIEAQQASLCNKHKLMRSLMMVQL